MPKPCLSPALNTAQTAFLRTFAQSPRVAAAARVAGVSRQAHYHWLRNHPGYARAFAAQCRLRPASLHAEVRLRKAALRRALEGVHQPVLFRGRPVVITGPKGRRTAVTRRHRSDTLLRRLLQSSYAALRSFELAHAATQSSCTPPARLTALQRLFAQLYGLTGSVSAAAQATGVSRQTHYLWLSNPRYHTACHDALGEVHDWVQAEVMKAALRPDRKVALYHGKPVILRGTRPLRKPRSYPKTLLALLEMHRPEQWADPVSRSPRRGRAR